MNLLLETEYNDTYMVITTLLHDIIQIKDFLIAQVWVGAVLDATQVQERRDQRLVGRPLRGYQLHQGCRGWCVFVCMCACVCLCE